VKFRLLLSLILSLTLCLSLVVYGAKDKDKKHKKDEPATTQAAAKAVNKFCAVEQDNPIDPKVPTYTYNGKVIGFCCEDCLPTFKKNPEKYMKTLK